MQHLQGAQGEALAAPDIDRHLAGSVYGLFGSEQHQGVIELTQAATGAQLVQHNVPVVRLHGQLGLVLGHFRFGVLFAARRLQLGFAVGHIRIQGVNPATDQEGTGVLQAVVKERANDVGHFPEFFFLGILLNAKATHGNAFIRIAFVLGRQAKQDFISSDTHMLAQFCDLVLQRLVAVVVDHRCQRRAEHGLGVQDRPQKIDQPIGIQREGGQTSRAQGGAHGLLQLIELLDQLAVVERSGLGDGEQQSHVLDHVVVIRPQRVAFARADVVDAPLGQLRKERRGDPLVHGDMALGQVVFKLLVQHG